MTGSIEFDDGNCASGFSSRKPLSSDVDAEASSVSESVTASESTGHLSTEEAEFSETGYSFSLFRLNYLVVTLVIMLADGLQGKQNFSGYGTQSSFCCNSQPMALILFIQAPIYMFYTTAMDFQSRHCIVLVL